MRRADRLVDIIQVLRLARTPVTAAAITAGLRYDPVTGDFYVTGIDASGNRVIADATYALLQSIDLTVLWRGQRERAFGSIRSAQR
jgi:hypothetical protein